MSVHLCSYAVATNGGDKERIMTDIYLAQFVRAFCL